MVYGSPQVQALYQKLAEDKIPGTSPGFGIAASAARGLPPLRIGIASGTAISRAGDWFGRPVNVASRVTAEALPGTVLVAEPTYQAAADAPGLRWFPQGARRLKGVSGDVRLFRVARPTP